LTSVLGVWGFLVFLVVFWVVNVFNPNTPQNTPQNKKIYWHQIRHEGVLG
jgi:hypothetical protein